MTAKARKAQRAPDETDEPNSGKLPEGNRDGEPQPDEPEPSTKSNPTEDEEHAGSEPEVPEVKKPAPPAPNEKKSAAPSRLARIVKWLATDLDGN